MKCEFEMRLAECEQYAYLLGGVQVTGVNAEDEMQLTASVEDDRKRPAKFVPRTDTQIAEHISKDMASNSRRLMAKRITHVKASEYSEVKERVAALPEDHNKLFDFLASWNGIKNIHSHFRYRFFSRIEELEEIHAKAV